MIWRGGLRPLLLAAALTSCSAESVSPSPTGLGSDAPAPQAPVEILFRLERREEQLYPLLPRLTLYADGRLLTWDPARDDLAVRTLGEAGIDAFLAEVLASGSFGESHGVPADPLPGSSIDPFTKGIGVDEFSLNPPDGPPIKVTTITTNDPRLFARSPERDALMALVDRLIAADWLAADSWVDSTPSRYVADAYLLLTGSVIFPLRCRSAPGKREAEAETSPVIATSTPSPGRSTCRRKASVRNSRRPMGRSRRSTIARSSGMRSRTPWRRRCSPGASLVICT